MTGETGTGYRNGVEEDPAESRTGDGSGRRSDRGTRKEPVSETEKNRSSQSVDEKDGIQKEEENDTASDSNHDPTSTGEDPYSNSPTESGNSNNEDVPGADGSSGSNDGVENSIEKDQENPESSEKRDQKSNAASTNSSSENRSATDEVGNPKEGHSGNTQQDDFGTEETDQSPPTDAKNEERDGEGLDSSRTEAGEEDGDTGHTGTETSSTNDFSDVPDDGVEEEQKESGTEESTNNDKQPKTQELNGTGKPGNESEQSEGSNLEEESDGVTKKEPSGSPGRGEKTEQDGESTIRSNSSTTEGADVADSGTIEKNENNEEKQGKESSKNQDKPEDEGTPGNRKTSDATQTPEGGSGDNGDGGAVSENSSVDREGKEGRKNPDMTPVKLTIVERETGHPIQEHVAVRLTALDKNGRPIWPAGQISRSTHGKATGKVHPDAKKIKLHLIPARKYREKRFQINRTDLPDVTVKLQKRSEEPVRVFLYVLHPKTKHFIGLTGSDRIENTELSCTIYDENGQPVKSEDGQRVKGEQNDGTFLFDPIDVSKLKPGHYWITGQIRLYDRESDRKSLYLLRHRFVIREEFSSNNKAITPVSGATVTGRVTTKNGDPIKNARVRVPAVSGTVQTVQETNFAYRKDNAPTFVSTTTDEHGEFRLQHVPLNRAVPVQIMLTDGVAEQLSLPESIPRNEGVLLTSEQVEISGVEKNNNLGTITLSNPFVQNRAKQDN